jgi:hypothetical protein
MFVKATSETGQDTSGGRREDQGLGGFGGLLDHGRQCGESGRSDEVFGTIPEDYFDTMPGVGEFEYDLWGSKRPRSGADRDEDQSLTSNRVLGYALVGGFFDRGLRRRGGAGARSGIQVIVAGVRRASNVFLVGLLRWPPEADLQLVGT